MSTSDALKESVDINMGMAESPALYGASPKRSHGSGYSHPLKRKMADSDGGEAREEGLCTAKKHRDTQPVAWSDRILGSSQPKTSTQTQAIDEMDIDNSNKGDELDSSLLDATKKMGIKHGNEVEMDIDWAEQVLQGFTYLRILTAFQDHFSWILTPISDIQPSPMSAQFRLGC